MEWPKRIDAHADDDTRRDERRFSLLRAEIESLADHRQQRCIAESDDKGKKEIRVRLSVESGSQSRQRSSLGKAYLPS